MTEPFVEGAGGPGEEEGGMHLEVHGETSLSANGEVIQPDEIPAPAERRALTRSIFAKGGISWTNVKVTIPGKTKKDDPVQILKGVSGELKPSRLTCIMGGSGSGKTTLLNVLSGRLTTNSRKKIHVEMDKYTFDSKVINPGSSAVQKYIAYAEQEDKLIATATVKEALVFSARLRLPREFTDQDIENIALSLMEDLQLSHRADSLIGGPRKRGISGGEKRRMSLALELVTRPTTLFLDEITSGLDSFSASVVMELCKKLTRGSKTMGGSQVFNAYEGWDNRLPTTILMTIHQPSSILFEMIDDIIILQKGRAVYQGPSGRAAMDFFEERGYALPAQYNPADWVIEVTQTNDFDKLKSQGFGTEPEPSNASEKASWTKSMRLEESLEIKRKEKLERASVWTELKVLFVRDMRDLVRDYHSMAIRTVIFVVGAAMVALVFEGVARSSLDSITGFLSHVGAIFLLVVTNVISMQLVVVQVAETQHVFIREYRSEHYRLFSYSAIRGIIDTTTFTLLSLFANIVFFFGLGLKGRFILIFAIQCLTLQVYVAVGTALAYTTEDPRSAREIIPLLMVMNLLLAGYFVSLEELPVYISWATWLMPVFSAFRLFLDEEFAACYDPVDPSTLEEPLPSSFRPFLNETFKECWDGQLFDGFDGTRLFCQEYLSQQDADGSSNFEYWMALISLLVGFRLIAAGLLYVRATSRQ